MRWYTCARVKFLEKKKIKKCGLKAQGRPPFRNPKGGRIEQS